VLGELKVSKVKGIVSQYGSDQVPEPVHRRLLQSVRASAFGVRSSTLEKPLNILRTRSISHSA